MSRHVRACGEGREDIARVNALAAAAAFENKVSGSVSSAAWR